MNIITIIVKLFVLIYCGYKFAAGDKEKNETLWYGMWIMFALS